MAPSCCIMPRSSLTPQSSTALPFRKRTKCMWSWRTAFPVGGIPIRWAFVGTAHRQATRDDVPLGDQPLDGEAQVEEGGTQHGGEPPHRRGTTSSSWRGLVVNEVGSDDLSHRRDGSRVQHLLVGAAKLYLFLLRRGHEMRPLSPAPARRSGLNPSPTSMLHTHRFRPDHPNE